MGRCNQKSLVGKFSVVKDLRHICVINVWALPEQLAVIMARAGIDEEHKEKVIVDIFCEKECLYTLTEVFNVENRPVLRNH